MYIDVQHIITSPLYPWRRVIKGHGGIDFVYSTALNGSRVAGS